MKNNIIHIPSQRLGFKQFSKESWDNFERGINISLRSAFRIMQAFLPIMQKRRYGRIVFLLSSNTNGISPKYQSSYVICKYSLLGLMKSLSVEYADKGITVNGVSPDMMDTKFLSEVPEMIIEQNSTKSPLGRNIQAKEIVPIISYLLSDESAPMTGQNILITGGI